MHRSRRAAARRHEQRHGKATDSDEPSCAEWINGAIVTTPNIVRQNASNVEYDAVN
jgi:hypothetical protein